jgi:hypothetical protein
MPKIYFIYKVAGKNPEELYKIELCQIKIKWIKREEMTHENTYRDDYRIGEK